MGTMEQHVFVRIGHSITNWNFGSDIAGSSLTKMKCVQLSFIDWHRTNSVVLWMQMKIVRQLVTGGLMFGIWCVRDVFFCYFLVFTPPFFLHINYFLNASVYIVRTQSIFIHLK